MDSLDEQAAEHLATYANIMGGDPKIFAAHIRKQHRTIQQNVGRLVQELIEQWAKDYTDNNFDLRNEATVRWAYETETTHLPYI